VTQARSKMALLTPATLALIRTKLPLTAALPTWPLTATSMAAAPTQSPEFQCQIRSASSKLDFPTTSFSHKALKFFKRGKPLKAELGLAGSYLMNRCANGVDVLDFFREFDLPDTFFSWYIVSELHLWMISVRLMSEDCNDCQEVRNWMLKQFWNDCDTRAKEVGEKSATERSEAVAEMAEQFNAAIMVYDEGIVGDDKTLANAIWRRFFNCRPDPDAEKLEMLVRYVRRTMSELDKTPLNKLVVETDFEWVPLKD